MNSALARAFLGSVFAASAAAAREPPLTSSNITLYGAYRMGGRLTETETGIGTGTDRTVVVNEHSSFAAALNLALDRGRQTEFFYSRQESVRSSGGPAGTVDRVPITIEYFHIGGTSFFEGFIAGPYVMGGIGATRAKPDFGGLRSATRLSMNLGLGYLLPLGGNLAARFEARGYGTLVDGEQVLFCGSDSGCVISVNGRALYQTEVLIGLSGSF